jgi:hypothetical protein
MRKENHGGNVGVFPVPQSQLLRACGVEKMRPDIQEEGGLRTCKFCARAWPVEAMLVSKSVGFICPQVEWNNCSDVQEANYNLHSARQINRDAA